MAHQREDQCCSAMSLRLKCSLSQAANVVAVLYAQQPFQTCGLNIGCFKFVGFLVFCEGKKTPKSAVILTAIKAFLKCAPYLSHDAAIEAESKTIFALENCQFLIGLVRRNAVTPLPILQGRKPGLSSESWHVLLELLSWISRRNVCVSRRKGAGC